MHEAKSNTNVYQLNDESDNSWSPPEEESKVMQYFKQREKDFDNRDIRKSKKKELFKLNKDKTMKSKEEIKEMHQHNIGLIGLIPEDVKVDRHRRATVQTHAIHI